MIILLLFSHFWFNWGYNVNDQLDFVLTVIKRDYNTNDRFIRWENGLNDRLKPVKNGRKQEMKMKANKTRNELQVSDSKTYPLKNVERTKNGWRTVKNGGKPSRIYSRKCLKSVTEAPRLGFSSQKQFFSPKQLKCTTKGVRDPLEQPPFAYLSEKGEEVAAQLAQASWVASSISNPASKMFWKAQIWKFENCYLHPILISSSPFFRNIRKSYGSLTEAYRTWLSSFFSSFSPILSEICLFRVTEELRKPRKHIGLDFLLFPLPFHQY